MTTNKPEVFTFNTLSEECVRLSDYEALQAERDLLRKHLQNLIDQTTPLEPEPGNPMWSRRIQLDEVIAERDQLRAECENLAESLELFISNPTPTSEDFDTARTALAAYRKGGDT